MNFEQHVGTQWNAAVKTKKLQTNVVDLMISGFMAIHFSIDIKFS